jgi:branched-chain amino acid aminotransferase
MTILDTMCPVNRLLDETPMPAWSQTFTFLDGEWHEGNHPFVGARTHAFWLGSSVFDGARAFEGVTPDLDKHFARLNRSAETMCLTPTMTVEAMLDLAKEGLKKFSPGAELYIRPMYWPEGGSATSAVAPDADSTRFCLCIYEAPLPAPTGVSITRSPYAKPLAVTMPIEAKAGCLYPNNGRALIEARSRGFDNCLMCDMIGNVAELATANIFMARDGVVMTPIANGSFLSGVTRQRVIELLRADGKDAREATLGFADFDGADEIFVVGNYGKVTPVRRIDGRDLQPGPFFHRARKLYWEYAHSC